MPLVTLKTDLKSLKYGLDRPFGDSSNQPYIQKQIPSENSSGYEIKVLANGVEKTQSLIITPDFKLRGGILAYNEADNNVSALSQLLLEDKKNTNLFASKMSFLSRNSVKTEMSTIGFNQGTYGVSNTLDQAQLGIQGFYFDALSQIPKITLNPFTFSTTYDEYLTNQKSNSEWNKLNRLTLLNDSIINNKKIQLPGTLNLYVLNPTEGSTGAISKAYIKVTGQNNIIRYQGGPGAVNGVGFTRIRFADKRTGIENAIKIYDAGANTLSPRALGYKQLSNQWNGEFNTDLKIQDFRKKVIIDSEVLKLNAKKSSILSLSPGYSSDEAKLPQTGATGRPGDIDTRFKMGSPGKISRNRLDYAYDPSQEIPLDFATALKMYEDTEVSSKAPEDIIKFRIAILNNNKNDGTAVYLHFRAFLDSFSDTYNSSWESINYAGRGETFYNYGGAFTREISLSFTLAAQSKTELLPMYEKLNYLASSLAPDYTKDGIMRGSLIRLTVGDYIIEQYGFIKGLSLDLFSSTWETAIDNKGGKDKSVGELPHMVKVTGMTFTPIHNFIPRKSPDYKNQQFTNFIALGSPGVDNLYNLSSKYLKNQVEDLAPINNLDDATANAGGIVA